MDSGPMLLLKSLVDHCKTKTAEVPELLRASKYTGNLLTKLYEIQSKFMRHFAPQLCTSLRYLASGPFEKALGSSFDVHRCLSASHWWMKREETGWNQAHASYIYIWYHNLSSPLYSLHVSEEKLTRNVHNLTIHDLFLHSTTLWYSAPPNGRVKPGVTKAEELQCVAKVSSWHTTGSTKHAINFASKNEEWSATNSDRTILSSLATRSQRLFSTIWQLGHRNRQTLAPAHEVLLRKSPRFPPSNHSNHSISCQSGFIEPTSWPREQCPTTT